MRFYTTEHTFYCGVDLHARTMYVCIHELERFLSAPDPLDPEVIYGSRVRKLDLCTHWRTRGRAYSR